MNMTLRPAQRDGRRYLNPIPTNTGGLSVMFKIAPSFFFRAAARSPGVPPGPFHTDPRVYDSQPHSGLRVTWFGHSSSLVEIDGVRILIDPVWDKRASPTRWSGPKRFFSAPLALEDMPPIDVVLISHDHYDHLGAGTIRRLAQSAAARNARWVTTRGVGAILSRLGVDLSHCKQLDWTESAQVGALTITAMPARHFSGRGLFNRFQTLWASFVLAGPSHKVFYGADSGEWSGFREVGQNFGPFDLTMLEIGASNPLWIDIHMGPQGAVRTFHALGGRGLFMPIHWGLFDLGLHYWTDPIVSIFAVEDLPLWSPNPGTPTEVVPGQTIRSEWWR